jgi:heterodisulfide reductase subunit A
MCSGRVDEKFILQAFKLGAPIVLVSGCHFVDCHYIDANRWTQRRMDRLWNRLERIGIRPERLQLEWMSAAEGQRFSQVMAEIEVMRTMVSHQEIEETKKILLKADGKKKRPAQSQEVEAGII